MQSKTQKVILVTGARKGIGRKLVEHYIEQGNYVIGCSRSKSDFAHENYSHFCFDVKDEKEVKSIIRSIKSEYKRLDVLINNAGAASLNHSLLTPTSTLETLWNTNFVGTFLFSREAAKLMSKSKFGRIINFSTVAVPLNLAGEAIYASTKSAIEELTRIMAKELAEYNITVNAVGPTPIETDLTRVVPENKIQDLLNSQAIQRLGKFEDVINVIDFYIQERSDFITGQTIYLGGVMK